MTGCIAYDSKSLIVIICLETIELFCTHSTLTHLSLFDCNSIGAIDHQGHVFGRDVDKTNCRVCQTALAYPSDISNAQINGFLFQYKLHT